VEYILPEAQEQVHFFDFGEESALNPLLKAAEDIKMGREEVLLGVG
jgi:hypothetical protein